MRGVVKVPISFKSILFGKAIFYHPYSTTRPCQEQFLSQPRTYMREPEKEVVFSSFSGRYCA
jgi:hypothetical protein